MIRFYGLSGEANDRYRPSGPNWDASQYGNVFELDNCFITEMIHHQSWGKLVAKLADPQTRLICMRRLHWKLMSNPKGSHLSSPPPARPTKSIRDSEQVPEDTEKQLLTEGYSHWLHTGIVLGLAGSGLKGDDIVRGGCSGIRKIQTMVMLSRVAIHVKYSILNLSPSAIPIDSDSSSSTRRPSLLCNEERFNQIRSRQRVDFRPTHT